MGVAEWLLEHRPQDSQEPRDTALSGQLPPRFSRPRHIDVEEPVEHKVVVKDPGKHDSVQRLRLRLHCRAVR